MRLFSILILSAALGTSSAALASEAEFQTSCEVELTGTRGQTALSATSERFTITSPYVKSVAQVQAGAYTVFADVGIRQPPGSKVLEPTILMQLFKDGNPVQGSVTIVFAQGLDFDGWTVGRAHSLRSFNFLNVTVDGKDYSRLDYACTVTRVL